MVLAGVIFAIECEIGVDGDTMFTNNSAEDDGGEKEPGTWIALNTVLMTTTALLSSKRALF